MGRDRILTIDVFAIIMIPIHCFTMKFRKGKIPGKLYLVLELKLGMISSEFCKNYN
jgi:hypothetical protein